MAHLEQGAAVEQRRWCAPDAPNRVAGGFSPPAPTPPRMRVRTGRFTVVKQIESSGL